MNLRAQNLGKMGKNSKVSPIMCTAVLFKAFGDVLTSLRLRSEEKVILKVGSVRHLGQ